MTKVEYEQTVNRLVGNTLSQVFYYEIDYTNENGIPYYGVHSIDENGIPLPKPEWNGDSRFDSLDFGLDLVTTSGDVFWITWNNEFECYNLSVKINPTEDRSGIRRWDVTEHSRWTSYMGKAITQVRVHWLPSIAYAYPAEYPQGLELIFDPDQEVFLSVLTVEPDGRWGGFTDNVTVFFDRQIAEQSRWASPEA